MKIADRVRRRVLSRRQSRPLNVLRVALEMAMTGFMFTMLIIMMLVEGATPHHGNMPVDMAHARHVVSMPGAKREDSIRIGLTRDGAMYFGHTEVRVGDIAEQIQEKVGSGSEHRVYLKIDARAKYGDVGAVVDAIRASGLWNVGLLVEKDQRAETQQ